MGKYEEALERAREIYNAPVATIVTRTFLEQIFPELKESEDERIRKMLVEQMERWKKCAEDNNVEQDVKDASAAIAYLEKQKEQKPVVRENDFVSNPKTSVEVLRHYLVWAGNSEEEDCPYTWKTLADAIRDGIKALEEQKPAEKSEKPIISEWSEEDEKMRAAVLQDLANIQAAFPKVNIQPEFDWLKALSANLKKRNEDIAKLCSNEWSEEDGLARDFLLKQTEQYIKVLESIKTEK